MINCFSYGWQCVGIIYNVILQKNTHTGFWCYYAFIPPKESSWTTGAMHPGKGDAVSVPFSARSVIWHAFQLYLSIWSAFSHNKNRNLSSSVVSRMWRTDKQWRERSEIRQPPFYFAKNIKKKNKLPTFYHHHHCRHHHCHHHLNTQEHLNANKARKKNPRIKVTRWI